jgi:hypothetical protein
VGYTWAIMTNSMSQDPGGLSNDLDATMIRALGSDFQGSSTRPSPNLPPGYLGP